MAIVRTASSAVRRLQQALLGVIGRLLRPTPHVPLSQWADAHRFVTRDNFGYDGRWDTSRVPALREPMDAMTDPGVESIVFMKPSRMGATEAMLNNAIGYYMDVDPSSILVVQPTQDDARKWSKEKLQPMLDATPRLKARIKPARSKDSANTILDKKFAGGKLGVIGTNAPRQFRQRDFRIILCDERDAYSRSSGKEGDPVKLAFKRADNFDNRKLVEISSPTIKGASGIEDSYDESDGRQFWVTCPHCQGRQLWVWSHLRWEKAGEGEAKVHLYATAHYVCAVSGCVIEERDKYHMNETGQWIAQRPGRRKRGYHCNALASNLAGASWPKLAEEWISAQASPESQQTFINQVLAETYELKGEIPDEEALFKRRETYAAEVPAGVGVLTSFMDLQDDRAEIVVRGWGVGQESWRIAHEVIWGNIEDSDFWATVDGVLLRTYQHESGVPLRIRLTLIDSGHRNDLVYKYVKPKQRRGIFASKGDKGDIRAPIVVRGKKPNDAGIKLVTVGTFPVKRKLLGRLRMARTGPGYMHFHRPPEELDAQDREYFKQFASEQLIFDKNRWGQKVPKFIQVDDRNEAIDCEGGNIAALHALGPAVYDHLDREVARVVARAKALAETATAETPAVAAKRPPRRKSRYVEGWRN